jgi:hypothetical protein
MYCLLFCCFYIICRENPLIDAERRRWVVHWPFKSKLYIKRKLEDDPSFTLYFNHEKHQHDGETELTCPELAQKLIQDQMDNHPEHDWYYVMNRKAA